MILLSPHTSTPPQLLHCNAPTHNCTWWADWQLLVPEGGPAVKLNDPIAVIAKKAADVPAFADFTIG